MDATNHEAATHPPALARTYVRVWAALLLLTGVTVGAYGLDLKHLAVFTALLVATLKSTLVALYFMHLRYERRLFGVMLVAILATYAVFVVLTFADYSFRTE